MCFFHTTSKTITYIWRSSFCLEPFQGRLVNHQPRLKPRHREVHRERECLKFLIILKILFLTQVVFEVTVLSFIQIFRHVKVQILIDRCWIKLPRSFNVSEEEWRTWRINANSQKEVNEYTWDLSLMLLISSITKLKLYWRGRDLFSVSKTKWIHFLGPYIYRMSSYMHMGVFLCCSQTRGTRQTVYPLDTWLDRDSSQLFPDRRSSFLDGQWQCSPYSSLPHTEQNWKKSTKSEW